MMSLIKKIAVSLIFMGAAVLLVWYGWATWKIEAKDYPAEIGTLRFFDEALYDYGLKAWADNDLEKAQHYFEEAVSSNPLNISAWLKLAEVSKASGNSGRAIEVLRFTHELTSNALEWKWKLILLAQELGVDEILFENLNYVIPYSKYRNDALLMLDIHFSGEVHQVVRVLAAENYEAYLLWLMRWQRLDDSWSVWQKIPVDDQGKLFQQYADFLVREKETKRAWAVWQEFRKDAPLVNPDFENEISQEVFDWNFSNDPKRNWQVERVSSVSESGAHALEISFSGIENLHFSHLSQLVPVESGRSYELSFWWRSEALSTDQRPYIEVSGYACDGKTWQSEMAPPDSEWQNQRVRFMVSDGCEAIRIRLRRNRSYKFDSKIKGKLWLDDFELEVVDDTST